MQLRAFAIASEVQHADEQVVIGGLDDAHIQGKVNMPHHYKGKDEPLRNLGCSVNRATANNCLEDLRFRVIRGRDFCNVVRKDNEVGVFASF